MPVSLDPLAPYLDEAATLVAQAAAMPKEDALAALEWPPDPALGHAAFPCFVLAKQRRQPPARIAAELAQSITPGPLVARAEAKGPYLNFFFDLRCLARDSVESAVRLGADCGRGEEGAGKTVVIDYSAPNIAKPFGIGHLRSTIIGGALYRIHERLGWGCVGINYMGDWGTQFGSLLYAYRTWGDPAQLEANAVGHLYQLYVRFHRELERDPSLADQARDWFRRLENDEPEAIALWREFRDLSLREFKRLYQRLGVDFDYYEGESFERQGAQRLVEQALRDGIAQEDEGAVIIPLQEDEPPPGAEALPPALLRKSDGTTLYETRDLAAAVRRWERFHFDLMLYVVGAPQALHFKQLFAALRRLGCDWADRCRHVAFGHLRLGGKMMSTRRGQLVLLEEVLDEAQALALRMIEEKNPDVQGKPEVSRRLAVGALFFGDLVNDRTQDVEFDWDQVLNLEGDTGPYIQYACVRISSIFRKFGADLPQSADFGLLQADAERDLILGIARFPFVVRSAARTLKPSVVARYTLDLAKQFSQFYHQCPVLQAEPSLREARLLLCRAAQATLESGLSLLGIPTVQEM